MAKKVLKAVTFRNHYRNLRKLKDINELYAWLQLGVYPKAESQKGVVNLKITIEKVK